jgi:hypothetical protein
MRIVIDPSSLQATASVLRSAADALGELCARVAGAVDGVYAPPSVAAYADSATASASSSIHSVIYELLDEAADLERRAACCCADQSTSLPVPALVGLAFGGAAISGASQVQVSSAVSPIAARGPGVAASAVSGSAPFGPGVSVATPAPVMAAPMAAPLAPAPMSLQQVLGMGTFGGGSPVGSGINMVWNPSATLSMAPQAGIGSFVPMANPPAAAGVASSVPLYGSSMNTAMGHLAVQPLNFSALSSMRIAERATISPVNMG